MNQNFSMYNLRQLLATQSKSNLDGHSLSLQKFKQLKASAIQKSKKSHRKSTQSLTMSRLNESQSGLKNIKSKTKDLMRHIKKSKIKIKNTSRDISASPSLTQMQGINSSVNLDKSGKVELGPIKDKSGTQQTQVVPKTSRTIYYPQNFKKLKKSSKIKLCKKKQ